MSKYTLIFTGKKGDSGDGTDFSVSTVQVTNAAKNLNVPNPAPQGLEEIKFQLVGLKYDKRNYAPCRVDAVVTVSECPLSAGIDDITAIFAGKTVEITGQAQIQSLPLDPVTVGSDYFVYKVKPVFQYDRAKGNTVPCTVELVIYSRDFLLTLDRFSKAYLSQKLSSDILASALKYGDNGGVLGGCKVDFESDVERLQFTSLDDKELIQPYHVQYNEDFYSFVSRIAARHGEFLFFEDGKLNLGLPKGKDAINLDPYTALDNSSVPVVLSMERDTISDSPLEVDSYYSNYLRREENMFDTIFATADVIKDQNAVAGKPIEIDEKKLYFNEDAYDEYFDIFGTTKEAGPDGVVQQQGCGFWLSLILTKVIPIFPSYSHDTKFSRAAMVVKAIKSVAMEEAAVAARVDETNGLYLDKRVKIPVANEEEQYGGNDKEKLCQFGSYTGPRPEKDEEGSPLQKYNFMRAFYASIRETELSASKRILKMKVRPGCAVLNVGDTVSFAGKNYIIIKVSAEYAFKEATDILAIDVIEVVDSDKPVCPPYDRCSEHEKAAPQIAVVSNHMDPRYLNRVRIKYPWQPESDLASPWVRTSTPMASPNGGACSFVMKAGSEVMVDYIDGNIDRPYIVGSLHTTRTNPTSLSIAYGDREIRSESGARLKLEMGNVANYVKNFVPFMGAATPFLSPLLGNGMIQLANWMPVMGRAAGKATLTDGFGLFEISGDTAERKVVIDSAIGKVSISALTGITVSAPLGDVTIEGHNIKLRAANNITIESGLNIKDDIDLLERQKRHKRLTGESDSLAMSMMKGAGDIAASTLSDMMLGAIDMSLLRIVYNAVVAPKEGTLKIKSHRFVNIEAGDGRAIDQAGGFAPTNFDVKSQVSEVENFAKAATESLRKRLKALRSSYDCCCECRSDANYGLKKTAEEIVRKSMSAGNNQFTDDELYDNNGIMSKMFNTYRATAKQFVGELSDRSIEFCTYTSDFKKCSGTFKDGLKPFSSSHQDILVLCMRTIYINHFRKNIPNDTELVLGFCNAPSDDAIETAMKKFEKALFRYAILKLTGTEGFCLKWDEGYALPPVPVDADGVGVWGELIRNMHVSFDDTSYKGHKVIRENFKNPFSISAGTVNSVWNPLQKGRVLISETPGTTLGITPNHNEWEAMDNLSIEFVRRFLAQK